MIQFRDRSLAYPKRSMPEIDPQCRRVQARLSDYLENALNPGQRTTIEAHLANCSFCHDLLDELKRTIALLGQLRETSPPQPSIAHLPQRKNLLE